MKTFMLNQNCRKLLSLGHYAVRVTFADAVLCAVCGALYGIVLGGFGAQARNTLTVSGIFSMGGTCAMVGFAVGAAIGVFGEVSRVRNLRQRLSERANRNVANSIEQRQSRAPETLKTSITQYPLMVIPGTQRPRVTALGG